MYGSDITIIYGRIGAKPVLYEKDGRHFTYVRVCVNDPDRKVGDKVYEGESRWHTVRASNSTAEYICRNADKGDVLFCVCQQSENRSTEEKDGVKIMRIEPVFTPIKGTHVDIVQRKAESKRVEESEDFSAASKGDNPDTELTDEDAEVITKLPF